MRWLGEFGSVKRVFGVHGDKDAVHGFAQEIEESLGLPVTVPKLDEVFELTANAVERLGVAGLSEAHVDPEFSGVVKVWEGGDQIFSGAYGLADRRFGVSNTPDTRFAMGPGSRLFTVVSAAVALSHHGYNLGVPVAEVLGRTAMGRITDHRAAVRRGAAEK